MLFFINTLSFSMDSMVNLNTSHVILYRSGLEYLHHNRLNLNTSHVILYLGQARLNTAAVVFKYISCYSLSGYAAYCLLISVFKYISCYSLSCSFKIIFFIIPTFKYISCYSLSYDPKDRILSLLVFKYISCYSLSIQKRQGGYKIYYLNTSHVILYQTFLIAFSLAIGI